MIKIIYRRTQESIRNFALDPINNLGYLLPILIGVSSFISGIVAYIKFIVNGGYVNQVNAVKESGIFAGYDKKFTVGTTGMMTSRVMGKIILILLFGELLLMLINYFKASGKAKRIIMIVDLVIMGIQIVLTTSVLWIVIGSLVAGDEIMYKGLKIFKGVTINPKTILITYAVITIISLICFFVLVLTTRNCRWMIKNSVIALAVAYFVNPLIVLFLQNVIPLATGTVALVIIGAIIIIIFRILTGGSEKESVRLSGDSGNFSGSKASGRKFSGGSSKKVNIGNLSERNEKKYQNNDFVIEETRAYIPDLNKFLGYKLWKVHGMTHDYIASDNGLVTREICSLEMFEKGKFHIYDSKSGKEIKSSDIPWMKQN